MHRGAIGVGKRADTPTDGARPAGLVPCHRLQPGVVGVREAFAPLPEDRPEQGGHLLRLVADDGHPALDGQPHEQHHEDERPLLPGADHAAGEEVDEVELGLPEHLEHAPGRVDGEQRAQPHPQEVAEGQRADAREKEPRARRRLPEDPGRHERHQRQVRRLQDRRRDAPHRPGGLEQVQHVFLGAEELAEVERQDEQEQRSAPPRTDTRRSIYPATARASSR